MQLSACYHITRSYQASLLEAVTEGGCETEALFNCVHGPYEKFEGINIQYSPLWMAHPGLLQTLMLFCTAMNVSYLIGMCQPLWKNQGCCQLSMTFIIVIGSRGENLIMIIVCRIIDLLVLLTHCVPCLRLPARCVLAPEFTTVLWTVLYYINNVVNWIWGFGFACSW